MLVWDNPQDEETSHQQAPDERRGHAVHVQALWPSTRSTDRSAVPHMPSRLSAQKQANRSTVEMRSLGQRWDRRSRGWEELTGCSCDGAPLDVAAASSEDLKIIKPFDVACCAIDFVLVTSMEIRNRSQWLQTFNVLSSVVQNSDYEFKNDLNINEKSFTNTGALC